MGLGLYIVRTIIKLHGGDITVSSVEGEYCESLNSGCQSSRRSSLPTKGIIYSKECYHDG